MNLYETIVPGSYIKGFVGNYCQAYFEINQHENGWWFKVDSDGWRGPFQSYDHASAEMKVRVERGPG